MIASFKSVSFSPTISRIWSSLQNFHLPNFDSSNIFFDARYLNANGFIKSAIIVLIASVWTAFVDDICEFLIFGTRQITIKSVNFSDWTSNICVNANVYAIVLVSGVIIASILFVAGGIRAFANKK